MIKMIKRKEPETTKSKLERIKNLISPQDCVLQMKTYKQHEIAEIIKLQKIYKILNR